MDDTTALRHMAAMAGKYMFVATMQGRMRRSELAIGHIRNYSSLELRRKLEVSGLEVLWIKGWGFPFYSPLYRSAIEWLPGGPPSGPIGATQPTHGRRALSLVSSELAWTRRRRQRPCAPGMNQQAPLVSVVLPCLNEAQGVGACVALALRALRDMNVPGEVLVVDNGSTDGSAEIAEKAGARVISERRRGYGSAYLRGFQEAQGR